MKVYSDLKYLLSFFYFFDSAVKVLVAIPVLSRGNRQSQFYPRKFGIDGRVVSTDTFST